MKSSSTIRATLAVAATALAALGLTALGSGGAQAATTTTATPLPAHVFAPYWEQYSGDDPETESQESGSHYLTAAFLSTPSPGSCTADWDGDSSQPISYSSYGSEFAAIQADGGNVIPSFGGAGADSDGTDIADSCTNVADIAQAYEDAITTYNVPRIDLDIEQASLSDTAGIDRRNEAVADVEQWAAANGRSIQFSYTLPANTYGLDATEEAIVQNAISVGATISIVNLMTFDYYLGTEQNMQTDAESAGSGLESQLASFYPSDSASELWDMIGITEMPGIDDYGPDETFTTAEAAPILSWAESHGINTLSFWAIERDNGGCPGTAGDDSCSGVSQSTWFFANTFEAFTSGGSSSAVGTIVGAASGKCLGDVGGSTTLKTAADIHTCNGTTPQSWTAESNGTLVDGNGLCLSITGSSTSAGAVADIYTCNGSAPEQWTVESGGTIVNNSSGLCLSVTNGATADDSTADIYTCNGSTSENWTVSS